MSFQHYPPTVFAAAGVLETCFALKATVEIRVGCRSLNVNRLSSGRFRGGYHVRGPVVENMIAVATY